jgi:hypothetical protein
MLEAEIIVDAEERIEHENDILSFFLHDIVEIADIAEKNAHIILSFLHGVRAGTDLLLDKLGHKDREDIAGVVVVLLNLVTSQEIVASLLDRFVVQMEKQSGDRQ